MTKKTLIVAAVAAVVGAYAGQAAALRGWHLPGVLYLAGTPKK